MALTKATYSMIQGAVFNVFDYGADKSGGTNSRVACQAAIDADVAADDRLRWRDLEQYALANGWADCALVPASLA